MSRRGQCRCGLVLTFQRTVQGYKMRCPSCGAVVRLRAGKKRRKPAVAKTERMALAPYLAPAEPDEFDVEPVPLVEAPTRSAGRSRRNNGTIAAVAIIAGVVVLAGAAGLALWLLG